MKNVKIENVSKQFGKVQGVKDLNLEIKTGEFFTFLGPSGCGKTTTLRMIAGFYYPTEGKIFFDDRDVTLLQPNKRNIGMVFQNYALFPHMTVDENIAFGLQVRKLSKQEITQKVDRIRGLVHLAQYGSRKINELSGGQQQRVALARALVIEPDILLLDEPLSNLDAKLREETRIEIKRIQSELGVTTIYVTHDQMEAMSMSDRIMVMDNGYVKQIGTPQEIYNRPVNRFVADFIGETNLIEATIFAINADEVQVKTKNGLVLTGRKQHSSPTLTHMIGDNVFISIRPESVNLGPGENTLTGTITFVEFTGISVNYIVDFIEFSLKVMIINKNAQLKNIGESITLNIAQESLYFLGE
ncbi:spermidine/putrescine ABC transporter ATP-binding protein [Lysinibacillus sphaericus]|uniref:Maltose/maltodextrin import ATP-binding protein MalK n=1 Tax=Lysinibacillus sphaericus TaxID=1421 RepID=A0A2S5CU69_LYSSH|nr:ABC transporter ATP-binding protein [Lysinibacillus sphaericus]OEC03385.1 spermidine/putrescine ABC transporter ATP-binding protein [Lysinibacillus sphaericus]POZ54272.1 Maltose/maltodextrin import ATP-binding protein MalK [Lysinibacillus sphaericus]